ncbi:spermidine synthase [soil metagenome]
MSTEWTTIATAELEDADLVLQQRGLDFLIWFDERVLMNSFSRSSEEQLSTLALAAIAPCAAPRILIGGLGMGFTLRAALDGLPAAGRVTVAELNQVIVDWCEGPLAAATDHALVDPRVTLTIGDVANVIAAAAPGSLDAIILDLYEGPFDELQGRTDPFYSASAIARQRQALSPTGVLAVWAEAEDPPYAVRLASGGFEVALHSISSGEACHVVYVARARN